MFHLLAPKDCVFDCYNYMLRHHHMISEINARNTLAMENIDINIDDFIYRGFSSMLIRLDGTRA